MENYKELLTALYKEHAPDNIDQIDFYLERYKGKEKQFYITQKAKYAKKRSVTDSKKILEEAMARIDSRKGKTGGDKKAVAKKVIKKPTLTETPKPKKKVLIAEDVKKDVIISETPKTAKKKLESKKEEKEIIITDTTATLNPSLKKPKEKTVIKPLVKDKEPIKEPKSEAINSMEDKERKLKDLELAKKRLTESRKKENKKSKFIWYVAAIALLILIIAFVVYFMKFYTSEDSKSQDVKVQKVIVENKKVSTEEGSNSIENKEEEKPTITEKEEPKKTTPVEKKVEKVEKPTRKEVKKEPAKTHPKTQSTAERLYSNDFDHPAVFVACFAVKSEEQAQKKVTTLKKLNLDAHYYWIPDMDSKGNSFFKVVIGPFTGLSEAYPSLTKVQEKVNFDAYIIIVK